MRLFFSADSMFLPENAFMQEEPLKDLKVAHNQRIIQNPSKTNLFYE